MSCGGVSSGTTCVIAGAFPSTPPSRGGLPEPPSLRAAGAPFLRAAGDPSLRELRLDGWRVCGCSGPGREGSGLWGPWPGPLGGCARGRLPGRLQKAVGSALTPLPHSVPTAPPCCSLPTCDEACALDPSLPSGPVLVFTSREAQGTFVGWALWRDQEFVLYFSENGLGLGCALWVSTRKPVCFHFFDIYFDNNEMQRRELFTLHTRKTPT